MGEGVFSLINLYYFVLENKYIYYVDNFMSCYISWKENSFRKIFGEVEGSNKMKWYRIISY